MNKTMLGLAALVVAGFVASAAMFTVEQTEQVLITRIGEPVRVINTPGLKFKIPMVETVISFDRRLLDYGLPSEEVILGDQRRLIVDSFTRYRIVDPLRYYQAVGPTEAGIRARLNSVVTSALRRVLGNEQLLNVLSSDRGRIMDLIRVQVNAEMQNFGVDVVDVRIRRADLPPENTQAILSRMQSERQRVAAQVRAEGDEAAARIRADADRERTVVLANARSTADRLRGEGEGEAIALYADAFNRDPGFFQTWRTLQAYRQSFASGGSRLVMTPSDGFFKLLRDGPPGLTPADGTLAAPANPPTPTPPPAP
jgi:membrane protease subunit HflC